MKKGKLDVQANEEFSVEFGDINGTKIFELPYASKHHRKNDHKKIKPAE